jgi:hypothetical protein
LYKRIRWRVRRRRRSIALALVLALAAVAVYVLWPGPNLREGSAELSSGTVRVGERRPDSYRIVYRLESRAGGELVVSTERLWVRRPFESRQESWSGPPPGTKRTSTSINAFGRIRFNNAGFNVAPAPAPQDRRVDALLQEAERGGYVDVRELRRVAGRTCRIHRIAGEGQSGSLLRLEDDAETYSDTCLDEAGLALEEVSVVDGDLLTRKLAVEVDESPELDDEMFRPGEVELSVRQGGGSVKEAEPTSRPPGTFWELPDEPRGFERQGRYAVIPPQAGFDDPTQRSGIITFVTDVWVRGIDVLIIEQGATLGGRDPFAADPNARKVQVGELGRGEVLYGLRTSEVRVLRKGGKFVRVFGTLEPSRLLAFARSLEERPGGELVYLD